MLSMKVLVYTYMHIHAHMYVFVHTANIERSNHASNGRLLEGKNNEKFLKRLIVGSLTRGG